MSTDKRIKEEEKQLIESYKLALMQGTQKKLLRNAHSSIVAVEKPKPKPKPSLFRYFIFGAFLLLEFVPMIWGSYLGITDLMATVPGLSTMLITAAGLVVCGIEAILYYAVKGPLLKRALGIPTLPPVDPCLDLYEKQLQILKNIDKLLLVGNKMDSAEYERYTSLAALFSEQIQDLKTYTLYVKSSFDDPELSVLEGKALVLVGDKIRIMNDKTFIANKDGSLVTVQLTSKEKEKLNQCKRDGVTGRLERLPEEIPFLDHLIDKTISASSQAAKVKIQKYTESPFKKGLRWVLSAVDLSLNVGGGYFLATSLLAGTAAAAALLGTPLGWSIIGLIIIGQFALRLAVGSNAMFNMLNPGAEKNKKVKEEINEYELNTRKYDDLLTAKKQAENTQSELGLIRGKLDKQQRQERAKNNPYVDSYKDSYLNAGLYKNRVPDRGTPRAEDFSEKLSVPQC